MGAPARGQVLTRQPLYQLLTPPSQPDPPDQSEDTEGLFQILVLSVGSIRAPRPQKGKTNGNPLTEAHQKKSLNFPEE